MEELRDERLSKIMSWMQSWIRGYLCRKDFKKLQSQRLALEVVQRNLRKYLKLRTWPWWKLWQKVKPLLNVSRVEDQIAVSIPNTSAFCCQIETSVSIPPVVAVVLVTRKLKISEDMLVGSEKCNQLQLEFSKKFHCAESLF
jgi:myosin heavy subunit